MRIALLTLLIFLTTTIAFAQQGFVPAITDPNFSNPTPQPQQLINPSLTETETVKTPIEENEEDVLLPYGAQLFKGQFSADAASGLNPDYVISSGDQLNVSLWGAVDFNEVLTVDQQGNIFIPEVGPVKVGGVKLIDLNTVVRKQVRRVYTSEVQVYTNLGNTQPVSVFVTGNVKAPGRYSGVATFTAFHYIDMAQGIDEERGSYRDIQLIRDNEVLETFDIYDFLEKGFSPKTNLKDGDTIFVRSQHPSVSVEGEARNRFRFEFTKALFTGLDVLQLARPMPEVTHASLSGTRNGKPFLDYLSIKEFEKADLSSGDIVTFLPGKIADTITVSISGQHNGPREMVVPLGTKLLDVLDYIPVNTTLSNTDAIHLRRKSVAEQQRQSLNESLNRLERKALTRTPINQADASQKAQEVLFLKDFIKRAKQIEPQGRVVVANSNGGYENIFLETDDEIIIPSVTSLVAVNGEVYDPKAVVYKSNKKTDYYINKAGGFSDFADKDGILVFKANGESVPYNKTTLQPGDEIIVLPKFKLNSLQVAKEVIDVISKAVVAAAVPIALADDD